MRQILLTTALLALCADIGIGGEKNAAAPDAGFAETSAYLKTHCLRCHGATKKSGGIRLDDMTTDVAKDLERWIAVRDQVRDGLMPPAKEPRPDSSESRKLVAWVSAQTGIKAAALPNQGNLIPHELLFGKPAPVGEGPPGRLWRLSADGYFGFVRDLNRGRSDKIIQPFTMIPERGIRDFAGLYTIDEPSTEILIRNAEMIVDAMCAHDIKDGVVKSKNDTVREFVLLMDPKLEPSRKQLEAAIHQMFKLALGRAPSDADVSRFLGLYDTCAKIGDRPGAAKTMLQAVLLRSDAMFRTELGQGKTEGGRRMLSGHELAIAVSLTLGDRRDTGLMNAAQKGALTSKDQVAEHVRRILDDPKNEKPRILKFFREYFEYGKAVDIFKEKPKTFVHAPQVLVSDTDRLILHILDADKDILREMLTTDLTFANYSLNKNKKGEGPKPAVVVNPNNNKGQKAPEFVYGFEKWPDTHPATLPKNQRLGILMQPSWLIAHATNFDNDPVRRGRWIRERLLGGTVPDLPIGVVAQVPDGKHRTFRDRLQVTRDAKCWKCHRMMDDLGLPFEQFDHFGLFRTAEIVEDPDATAKNVDKKGKSLGPVMKDAKLDTTGKITDSGDTKLDGDVADPRTMVRRLADSERVRQVFVRHAFRFFLGRNETLSDARTLQEADRAYVSSGGSFKALVTALLTSDSFLYRATSSKIK